MPKMLVSRRQWLRRLIVPEIVGLLVAVKLISLPLFNTWALRSYHQSNFGAAQQQLAPLGFLNVVESYKYHFNRGVMFYRQQNFAAATTAFERAQAAAPPAFYCQATFNLILAIEAQADAALAAKDYPTAIQHYQAMVKLAPAADKCNLNLKERQAGQEAQQASDRGQQKTDQAKQAQTAANQPASDQTQSSSQAEPSQTQQNQLQQSIEQSLQRRQQAQQGPSATSPLKERRFEAKNW